MNEQEKKIKVVKELRLIATYSEQGIKELAGDNYNEVVYLLSDIKSAAETLAGSLEAE